MKPLHRDRIPAYPAGRRLMPALVLLGLLLAPVSTSAYELTGSLNVNTAGFEELRELPFIGEARARTILDYRRQNGPFGNLEELQRAELIGPLTFAAIRSYLTLTGPTTLASAEGDTVSSATIRSRILARPGEIRILADEEYFPALIDYLRTATERIDMSMFLFKIGKAPDNLPSKVADELIRAAGRGVQVRVFLENSGYDPSINEINLETAARLRRHHVSVLFDPPWITTHTKLVVIDSTYVLAGSHNLTHSALGRNNEFSLLVNNPTLAGQVLTYMNGLPVR